MKITVHLQEPAHSEAFLALLEKLQLSYGVIDDQPALAENPTDKEIILAGGEMPYLEEMLAEAEQLRGDRP
jgi:hypothetical protein